MALTEQANIQRSKEYLFVGLGAANSLILLAFERLGLLNKNNFAIIEPSFDSLKSKTFCFWAEEDELNKLDLHPLIDYQWPKLQFSNHEPQSIFPYQYYCVKGDTLYQQAKRIIDRYQPTFYTSSFSKDVIQIDTGKIEVVIDNVKYLVNKVFDNRPPAFNQPKINESHLLQSFYGWKVKTEDKKFNTSTAILMDFDIPQQGYCQFVYVLPFSDSDALFEVTKFGKSTIDREEAKSILQDYIKTEKYIIEDEEEGCIPMSSATLNLKQSNNTNWIETGSRANLIKPSTGYAFLKMAEDASQLAKHEKSNAQIVYSRKKVSSRFSFYDRLLLKIIEQQPDKGKGIFQALFKSIQTKKVLTFLKEKSTIADELKIFSVLPLFLFLKTAFKDVLFTLLRISPVVQTLVLTVVCILLMHIQFEQAIWVLLGFGFFTIGIAHGAVDHLTQHNLRSNSDLIKFVLRYITKGIALGLIWYWQPDIALLAFLIFSAWHFGQADFEAWRKTTGLNSFLWGTLLLGLLLTSHFNETLGILELIPGLITIENLKTVQPEFIIVLQFVFYFFGIGLAVYTKNVFVILSLFNMYLLNYLPLLVSFGLFFIFQHSQHGFIYLKNQLTLTTKQFFMKALPFSFAGSLFIVLFIFLTNKPDWGLFFILLSCLSMPHVISMDLFYRTQKIE